MLRRMMTPSSYQTKAEGFKSHGQNTSRNSINICGKDGWTDRRMDGWMDGWIFSINHGSMDSSVIEVEGKLIYYHLFHSMHERNKVRWGN